MLSCSNYAHVISYHAWKGVSKIKHACKGSPRFNMLLSKGAQKKKSPIATTSKTHGGSPKGIHVGSF